ncbi:MAG: hypothetical protein ACWA5K_05290 [bacterium]
MGAVIVMMVVMFVATTENGKDLRAFSISTTKRKRRARCQRAGHKAGRNDRLRDHKRQQQNPSKSDFSCALMSMGHVIQAGSSKRKSRSQWETGFARSVVRYYLYF